MPFAVKAILTAIVLIAGWFYADHIGATDHLREAYEFATDNDGPTAPISADLDPEELLEGLGQVPITDPMDVDYDREGQFGNGWLDINGTGCDTRNEMLARDLRDVVLDDDGCTVLNGTLDEPFTGTVIDFVRGPDTSTAVHIDHMVPLSWAAQHGALEWDTETREHFANDPANLLAVDGPANSAKGDSGPGEWMPDNTDFHCDYAATFAAVVLDYDLVINSTDSSALQGTLAQC